MNLDALKQAGIDTTAAMRRFVNKQSLYEKVLTKFIADKTIERVRAAYENTDSDALLKSAHEFKGMCGNLALEKLYGLAADLVTLLRGEHTQAEVDALYKAMNEQYELDIIAIKAALE